MILLQKLGSIDVEALVREFNVSPPTIRRDLQYREDRRALIRHHEGTKLIRKMIERTTGKKFILCDYTKIGIKHSFLSGDVKDIDFLITDINASDEELDKIKEENVKIIKLKPLQIL